MVAVGESIAQPPQVIYTSEMGPLAFWVFGAIITFLVIVLGFTIVGILFYNSYLDNQNTLQLQLTNLTNAINNLQTQINTLKNTTTSTNSNSNSQVTLNSTALLTNLVVYNSTTVYNGIQFGNYSNLSIYYEYVDVVNATFGSQTFGPYSLYYRRVGSMVSVFVPAVVGATSSGNTGYNIYVPITNPLFFPVVGAFSMMNIYVYNAGTLTDGYIRIGNSGSPLFIITITSGTFTGGLSTNGMVSQVVFSYIV